MSSERLVYIVVLAWNHKEETLASLESLSASDYAAMRLVVVDNASTDGTAETVRARFPAVEVLRSETNRGISGGYNLGIDYALKQAADYVAVANNDIEVDRAMLSALVRTLEDQPQAGMAMPKLYHYYGDRTHLWCPGAYWRPFPPEVKMSVDIADGPPFDTLHPIDYAPSCFLLIRREALEKVGGFDTGYFFYYDDWDFSVRMRKAGYTILFVPEAKLWHKVSVSTQKSDRPAQWWRILGKSTVRFYLRHVTPLALCLFSGWFVIRESIKLKFTRIPPFLSGVWEGLLAPASGQRPAI
jgi:GT2 family glycosyltransferase